MALLSQDQLYELANKLCVRLGNLQKVLPCNRSALHDYTVMVCPAAHILFLRMLSMKLCRVVADSCIVPPFRAAVQQLNHSILKLTRAMWL